MSAPRRWWGIEAAQSVIAHLEYDAGPTPIKAIDASKVIERTVDQHRLRETLKVRLLSQRAGLFKLCNTKSTMDDFDQPTARVRLYFDRTLALSANIAAVSGTGWSAAWGWFRDRLPLPSDRISAKCARTRAGLMAILTLTTSRRPPSMIGRMHAAREAQDARRADREERRSNLA